jgi:hypothetical protein
LNVLNTLLTVTEIIMLLLRFEVLKVGYIVVCWVTALCHLVGGYQLFGEVLVPTY